MKEQKGLKMWQKIGYGIGDLGSNFAWTTVVSFVLIYFTNVVGLQAGVVGTLMAFSRVLDGISDVIMGRIIDVTHSRIGKARFWYLVSTFPTAICVFLIFNVPAVLSLNGKYVYTFIVYTLMGAVFYTMSNISYSTLVALVTKNEKDRIQMSSYRFMFAMVGVIAITSATSGLVDAFGGGQTGWRTVSIIYTIIAFVGLIIPFFCVHELPESELMEEVPRAGMNQMEEKKTGFFTSIKLLLTNKYFVLILLVYFFNYLLSGVNSGVMVFYATYVLKNTTVMGLLSMASMLPMIIFMPFMAKIVGKAGSMQRSCVIGTVISIIGGVIILFGGNFSFALLLVGLLVKCIGTLPGTSTFGPLTAAANENIQLRTGQDLTGMFFSCSSVGTKLGQGLGTALTGILLDLGRFDGMAAVQAPSAVSMIKYLYILTPVIGSVITLVIYLGMDVEKKNSMLKA